MASVLNDDESFEHTLLVVREVHVYKLPPRGTSGGYKCAEWLVSDKIWSGRLRLVSILNNCQIRLEDPATGDLFAACPVPIGQRDVVVEPVLDSSRYFVVRVQNDHGRHAFLGLGFNERNEAFDFNVALSDHEKHAARDRSSVLESSRDVIEETKLENRVFQPSTDFRLKEGETIRINVKTKPAVSLPGKKLITTSDSVTSMSSIGAMKAPLAPPPGGSRIRKPLPPPAGAKAVSKPMAAQSASHSPLKKDEFPNMRDLKASLPSGSKPASRTVTNDAQSPASGWAAF